MVFLPCTCRGHAGRRPVLRPSIRIVRIVTHIWTSCRTVYWPSDLEKKELFEHITLFNVVKRTNGVNHI